MGGGCIRRSLCELATMPPLHLEGLVGEMVDVLLRYVCHGTVSGSIGTFNITSCTVSQKNCPRNLMDVGRNVVIRML